MNEEFSGKIGAEKLELLSQNTINIEDISYIFKYLQQKT
jgi:hypothetical protein